MVAIESDIDRTSLLRFRETHRFLNTHAETSLGPGLGLDFANSFWCYRGGNWSSRQMEARDIGYWNGDDPTNPTWYADELAAYARAGRFSTLHSFGRFGTNFTREHAERALEMLDRENIAFKLWSNHGSVHHQNVATSLDGRDDRHGSTPGSPCYHTDLLLQYGVRFFWTGGVNSNNEGTTKPLHKATLSDGSKVWVFERNNSLYHDAGDLDLLLRKGAIFSSRSRWAASIVWQAYLLEFSLGQPRLDRLMEQGLYCIYGQHLGNQLGAANFTPGAAAALRRLKQHHDKGAILVSSTERMLRYYLAATYAKVDFNTLEDKHVIDIRSIRDPVNGRHAPTLEDVRGLTFEIEEEPADAAKPCQILLNGKPIADADVFDMRAPAGRVAGVRWHDVDTTDYTAEFEAKDEAPLYFRLESADVDAAEAPKAEGDGVFQLTPAEMTFVANEAGFAGSDGGVTAGDTAKQWRKALKRLGAESKQAPLPEAGAEDGVVDAFKTSIKAASKGVSSRLAIMSAPVSGLSLAGALDAFLGGPPRGTVRMLHAVTGAAVLDQVAKAFAAGDDARAGALLDRLAASELRRMAPARLPDGPDLVRDRIELERLLLILEIQNFGAVPSGRTAAPDLTGRRDLCIMLAPGAQFSQRSIARLCRYHEAAGDADRYLLRIIDFAAETVGAETGLTFFTKTTKPVLGGHATDLRRACFEYTVARADGANNGAAKALDKAIASKSDFLTTDERALLARTVFHDRDVAGIEALTAPVASSAECLSVLGWAQYREEAYAAARETFRHAAEWAPALQSPMTGLLASEQKLGDAPLSLNALDRHFDEAHRAAVEELTLVDWPNDRPRDQMNWN